VADRRDARRAARGETKNKKKKPHLSNLLSPRRLRHPSVRGVSVDTACVVSWNETWKRFSGTR
jgi:hypothetical protein